MFNIFRKSGAGPSAQTQPAANSDDIIASGPNNGYDEDEFRGAGEGDRTDGTDNGYDQDEFSEGGGGDGTVHSNNGYGDEFVGGGHGREDYGGDYGGGGGGDDDDEFRDLLPENPDDNDVDSNPSENNSPGLDEGTSTQQSDSSERTTQTSNTQSGLGMFKEKKKTESVKTGEKRDATGPMVKDPMVASHPSTLSQKKPEKKVTWNDADDDDDASFTARNPNLDAKSHQKPHLEFRDDDDESSMVQQEDDAARLPAEKAGGGHEKMALSFEDKDERNHDDSKSRLLNSKTQDLMVANEFAEELKEAPRSGQSATGQEMEIDWETFRPGLEKAAQRNGLLTTSANHSGEKIKNGSLHLNSGNGTIRSVNEERILPAQLPEVERQTIRNGNVNQSASVARYEEATMVSRGVGPPSKNFRTSLTPNSPNRGQEPSSHATSMLQGNQASKAQKQTRTAENSRHQSLLRVGGNNQEAQHGRCATSERHRHQILPRSMSGQGGMPNVSKANGLLATMNGGSSLQRAAGLATTMTNNRGASDSLVPQTTLTSGLVSDHTGNNGNGNVIASKTSRGTLQNQGGDNDRLIPRPPQRLVPTTPSPIQNSTGRPRPHESKQAAMTDAGKADLLLKTPTARNSHTEATKPTKDHHAAQRSSTGPPNEITPGPKTASKMSAPPAPEQVRDPIDMMDLDVAMQHSQRIIPAGNETNQRQFETNLETFENTIRDLEDMHQRSETALLDLNVRLSTAYSETLEDQADLSMFLGSLFDLGADFDTLIAEYQEFLAD